MMSTLENTDENRMIFVCLAHHILAKLSTWCFEHSGHIILYLLTRATLMSPGKDQTRICGDIDIYIYIYIFIGITYILKFHEVLF